MDERDPVELAIAFAVGALVGVGATLLLRREEDLPERIARQVRRSRRSLERGARRAGDAGEVVTRVGRKALQEFRDEMAHVVGAAREQLADEVYAQLRAGKREQRRKRR